MVEGTPARPFDVSAMGEAAILLQSSSPLDLRVQEIIWQVAREALTWPAVVDAIPGVNNLLLLFDPAEIVRPQLEARLERAWAAAGPWEGASKLVEVPVSYGGPFGPDLLDLCALTGLTAGEVAKRHAAPTYVVMAVGGQPGFGYLGGLDPALAMPRRAIPRQHVELGSVGIGGVQTAVLTATSPSGWNLIGHSAVPFFDAQVEPPALLAAGDRVRFVVKDVST